jgi:heptosyltransferase-3
MSSIAILFPGALGDFLCLWPSLQALVESTGQPIRVFAKPACLDLLEPERFERLSIDRREIADLFGAGSLGEETRALFAGTECAHSWTGHGDESFARRLGLAAGGAPHVHPFRGMAAGEHASEYFARCLGVRPVTRLLRPRPGADAWAEEFWSRHALGERTLAIHPGSGSAKKNWEGIPEIASGWRREHDGRVLILTGPAEEPCTSGASLDAIVRNGRLDRVAALLRRAHLYLGNDSGVSHLAGLVGARGVVLFGPTDPQTWRPLGGGVRVLHSPDPCPACGPERLCVHRMPVSRILEAVLELDPPRRSAADPGNGASGALCRTRRID